MTRRQGKRFFDILRSAALGAALFLCGHAVSAQEPVTLTSENGGLELTGRIIGYDGRFLTIESRYGPLTLIYANVTCTGTDCPDRENWVPRLRLSGASRLSEVLLPALLDAYTRGRGLTLQSQEDGATFAVLDADEAPVWNIVIRGATTEEGFADLVTFQADAVLALREMTAPEATRAAEVGLTTLADPAQLHVLGYDGIVPVVSPLASLDTITLGDLAAGFAGAALTGEAANVESWHLTGAEDGLAQAFTRRVLGNRTVSDQAVRHADQIGLTDTVARDPGALGIATLGRTGAAQALGLSDRCGFQAVPTLTALKTGDYPLTMPLYLYVGQPRPAPILADFLAWLRTPEAHLVARRAGFVDRGAIPIPLDAQGQRFVNAIKAAGPDLSLTELQRLVNTLTRLTRFSTTFRFERGTVRLEPASGSALRDLGEAIRAGDFGGRTLLLAGFSDGRGEAEANRVLSLDRAQAVADALRAELGTDWPENVSLDVAGFGEALPMGCDDTVWGRRANRRVELWVSD